MTTGSLYSRVVQTPSPNGVGQLYSKVAQSPSATGTGSLYSKTVQSPTRDSIGSIYSYVPQPIKPGKNALKEVIKRDVPRAYWELEEAVAATQFVDSINGALLEERGDVTPATAGYDAASLAITNWAAANHLVWPLQPVLAGAHTVECLFNLGGTVPANMGLWGARGPVNFASSLFLTNASTVHVSVGTGAAWAHDTSFALATPLSLTDWHHLGVVVEATKRTVYLNGQLVSEVTYASIVPRFTSADHLLRVGGIGSLHGTVAGHAALKIDEFAVYDKALTPERFQIRNDADLANAENAQFSGFTGWGVPL